MAARESLEHMSLADFINSLNQKKSLKLSEKDIQSTVRTLEEQWFTTAAELESLDAEAIGFLDMPAQLGDAILEFFGKGNGGLRADNLVYIPEDAPSKDAPAEDEEAMFATILGRDRPQSTSMEEVLKKVIEESENNDFVLAGIQRMLKTTLDEDDSKNSTMRKNVLRGYLKQVNSKRGRSISVDMEALVARAEEAKSPPVTLDCTHTFETNVLHKYLMNLVGKKEAVGITCPDDSCSVEINVKYIQQVLNADEFNQYLEATLMAFIEHDNLSFQCPNKTCNAWISVSPPAPQEPPNPMTEKDDDGQPLTVETWRHFHEFRMRCRQCHTVFCADCKRIPYHKGFSCAQFVEHESSRHCRFCNTKLTGLNTAKEPHGAGVRDVCTEEECLDKREVCCGRIKECGCACNGVRDEKLEDCLPCLKCDLEGLGEEFCSICYVEALKDAPCIQLGNGCDHVFHYQCIINRLKAGWPGARIGFEFLNCPLCHKYGGGHPAIQHEMKEIGELKEQVEEMAMERLKYDKREADAQIVEQSGRFFEDPLGFAMYQYLFYKCHKCKKPYFAGGYQCQEANAPFDAEDLMCPGCQPPIAGSISECPKHGKDWLAFKCRFCCTFANWYCWANTHFCGECHKSGVWQTLCEFRSGKNKKRFWEYRQCDGLRKEIDKIMRLDGTDDEKETQMKSLTADPNSCPLRVPHPPNGMEFGLGCSMCQDKQSEEANRLAAEKAKQEAEEMAQAFQKVSDLLAKNPNGLMLKYQSDFDNNGLFSFLGSCAGSIKWHNPADVGFVELRTSGLMGDSVSLSTLCAKDLVRCVTKPIRNSWIQVDLKKLSLEPMAYTLKHYSSWDTECLRSWVLEGSNDGLTWSLLSKHTNDKSLNLKGETKTWGIRSNGQRFRMFRLIQIGVNSNNHYYVALSGMEFYGKLYDSVPEVKYEVEDDSKVPSKVFKHQFDFDTNGIFYHLGTNMGQSREWKNPSMIGEVNVRSSELAAKPPSMPAHAIVGRQTVRCVTVARPGMWFVVDLKDKRALVTHYTMRHYNSWDTEALRNWRFEGSNDGVQWTPLRVHNDDAGLNAKGATKTWAIPDPKGFFAMFRIFQTGKNSNNHYYLACSGLELYGELKVNAPLRVPPRGVVMPYTYDFDCNGLFYWLGTRGRSQPYRNPANTGLVVCSASAMATNPPSHPVSAIVGRNLVRCVTAAQPHMWMMVDLKDKAVHVTHYTIRHYNSWDTEALRNWVLEGSNDGIKWIVLREHKNDWALDKKGATFTWEVNAGPNRYRMLRIRQTGLNSNNHHYLACSGLEFYGSVHNANQSATGGLGAVTNVLAGGPIATAPIVSEPQGIKDGMEFKYEYDFDQNGVLFWLGTAQRTKPYNNPGMTGVVKVTSSPLASQSMPEWAAAGRELCRCVTEPKKNTWFAFDLGKVFVIPTAYTLRHYDSWDTEALRSWKLEGSIDGKKWKTLMNHKKDESLSKKGASHTWPIKGIVKSYSMFRIFQTGHNSNGHWYLPLSGFEIYGTVWSFRKKM